MTADSLAAEGTLSFARTIFAVSQPVCRPTGSQSEAVRQRA